MLPVGHAPILERILRWLKDNGISDVVISTGYLGNMIESYFSDGSDFGLSIEYAKSRKPLGIAGQLRSAEPKLGQRFVCLYGDAILDFDLRSLISFHEKKRALLTMSLMSYKVQGKYGVIELKEDGRIGRWKEKPVVETDINVGCYVMEKRYLEYIPPNSVYGMKEAFEAAMEKKEPLYGLKVPGTFWDIGDKAAYKEADEYYSKLDGKVP
jgi:NDP-sugar pyrophosphorylase family protein